MAGILRGTTGLGKIRPQLANPRYTALRGQWILPPHRMSSKATPPRALPRARHSPMPPSQVLSNPTPLPSHPEEPSPSSPPPRPPLLSPNIVVGAAIAVCIGTWGYISLEYGHDSKTNQFIDDNFTMSRRNVEQGRWWVLITSTFTHFSFIHLGLNMSALWSFGKDTVLMFRPAGFAILWIGGGVGGSLVNFYWPSIMNWAVKNKILRRPYGVREWSQASVGASGSICGMWGVMMALMLRAGRLPGPFELLFIGGSVYCIFSGDLPQIGHVTHIGGLAAGAALWPVVRRFARRGI